MKPVMDNQMNPPEGTSPKIALASYTRNEKVWGTQRNQDNLNPWHNNVKDIMFYL